MPRRRRGDLEFDLGGYLAGCVSCLLQASYLIAVGITGAERGVGSAELITYNALLSAPVLALVTFATGELRDGARRVAEFAREGDADSERRLPPRSSRARSSTTRCSCAP